MLIRQTVVVTAGLLVLSASATWAADRSLKVVPANGSTLLVKAFTVPANTTITGVTFESNAANNTFPEVTLAQGPAGSLSGATTLRTATNVSPGSTEGSVTWSTSVTTSAAGTYYIAVRMPASNTTALAADDTEAPNGSYVTGGVDDALLPVKADLAIHLTTSGGSLKAGGEVRPQPDLEGRVDALALDVRNVDLARVTIAVRLPRSSEVSLDVYDVSGRKVRALHRGVLPAGEHEHAWDGRDDTGHEVAGGLYLIRLVADGTTITRKAVFAR